jgi:hypothetical protein
MAESPAHQFGQYLGNVLEALFLPELTDFCASRNLYVDCHGERAGVRSGKKVTWEDNYGNKHDLDFVIEKNGSTTMRGRPLAFIEAAWRRYTKHSKNKAQEIQGAVLPIAEKYAWDKPFLGAILAGEFTGNSLTQLRSLDFNVVYIAYSDIVQTYLKNGINIAFDEETPDHHFTRALASIAAAGDKFQEKIIADLRASNRAQLDAFLGNLKKKLLRHVDKIFVVPLFGKEYQFSNIEEVIEFIKDNSPLNTDGTFRCYEIIVRYSNGDKLEASFADKAEAERFLRYAAG